MTYDEIIAWAKEAYPISMYKTSTYTQWLTDVEQDFESQNHFFPANCYDLMENAWNDYWDRHARPDKRVNPLEAYDERKKISDKTAYRFSHRRPTETFSPSYIAKEFNYNPNTMRRVFQELTKAGVLERVSRGKYRYIG